MDPRLISGIARSYYWAAEHMQSKLVSLLGAGPTEGVDPSSKNSLQVTNDAQRSPRHSAQGGRFTLTGGQCRVSAAPAQGPECTRSGPPAEGHPPSCHLNSNGRATNTKKEAPPGLGLRPKRLSPHPGFWSWPYSSRQSAIGPQPTSECIRTRRGRSTGSGCSFTGCCR